MLNEKDSCKFLRFSSIAVDLQKAFSESAVKIPFLSETKEFLRANPDQNYAIPAFVNGDSTIIVMRFKKSKAEFMTLINPTYLSVTGFILSEEQQYGVEGTYLVPRHPKIEVMFVKLPDGQSVKQTLVGKSAIAFQQAYEALTGKYICDFGLRIDDYPEYQNGTEEDRNIIANAYMSALKDIQEESLKNDPELKKYTEAADFLSEKIHVGVEADKIIEEARKNEKRDVSVKTDLSVGGESNSCSEECK